MWPFEYEWIPLPQKNATFRDGRMFLLFSNKIADVQTYAERQGIEGK